MPPETRLNTQRSKRIRSTDNGRMRTIQFRLATTEGPEGNAQLGPLGILGAWGTPQTQSIPKCGINMKRDKWPRAVETERAKSNQYRLASAEGPEGKAQLDPLKVEGTRRTPQTQPTPKTRINMRRSKLP